ncbi:solute carrier family 2, facilitated glucose transporter member 5-like [Lacerta agilis]|uniref:solute carrier family 2, facilitated glucose transporter member 5-like n=1 Tax=Lacerta agilis TaxID=80427 RepID=UPI0014192EFB|nr:solute carrier family 2, facilitated glucose transporter member 5-like [Lacerta agilis]
MPLLQIFLLPLLPESPRYLFIQKEDENSAIKVLKKLRDTDDVGDEIEELQLEDIIEKDEKNMDSLKLMMTPSLKWQVIRIIVLMGGEQLDGLNVTVMGAYIFLLFWPISVATFFVIFRIIPETKMKAFVQIRRSMLKQKQRKKPTKKRRIK